MASFNKVMLLGNLTEDVELKSIPSGTSVADLRLAVSEKYKSKAGEDVESVVFVDVVTWGAQAENCAKYLSKGSPIFVEGKLQLDQWEKDGQKRSKIRVRAISVQFMSTKGDSAGGKPGVDKMIAEAEAGEAAASKSQIKEPGPDFDAVEPDGDIPF